MKAANEWIQGLQDRVNSFAGLSDSDFTAVITPYRDARDAELARQEAARETAGEDEDPMKETNRLLSELNAKAEEEIGAINGLGKGSDKNPAKLRWGAMGAEDFYEIQRLGV
jgi:hypothetical protein